MKPRTKTFDASKLAGLKLGTTPQNPKTPNEFKKNDIKIAIVYTYNNELNKMVESDLV